MLKEFKNVSVNYEGEALIKINDKTYNNVSKEVLLEELRKLN